MVNHASIVSSPLVRCFSCRGMALLMLRCTNRINFQPVDIVHLVHTKQISREDAQFIISTVPLATDPSASTMGHALDAPETSSSSDSPPPHTNNLVKPTPMKAYTSNTSATAMMQSHKEARRTVPKPPVANTFQARALWDYNVDNEVNTRILRFDNA